MNGHDLVMFGQFLGECNQLFKVQQRIVIPQERITDTIRQLTPKYTGYEYVFQKDWSSLKKTVKWLLALMLVTFPFIIGKNFFESAKTLVLFLVFLLVAIILWIIAGAFWGNKLTTNFPGLKEFLKNQFLWTFLEMVTAFLIYLIVITAMVFNQFSIPQKTYIIVVSVIAISLIIIMYRSIGHEEAMLWVIAIVNLSSLCGLGELVIRFSNHAKLDWLQKLIKPFRMMEIGEITLVVLVILMAAMGVTIGYGIKRYWFIDAVIEEMNG